VGSTDRMAQYVCGKTRRWQVILYDSSLTLATPEL